MSSFWIARDPGTILRGAGSTVTAIHAFVLDTFSWPTHCSGRLIFHVANVDAFWGHLKEEGFDPEIPQDTSWGERYFHMLESGWPRAVVCSASQLGFGPVGISRLKFPPGGAITCVFAGGLREARHYSYADTRPSARSG